MRFSEVRRDAGRSPCKLVYLGLCCVLRAMRRDHGRVGEPASIYIPALGIVCITHYGSLLVSVTSWGLCCIPLQIYGHAHTTSDGVPCGISEITIIWVLNYSCPVLSRWAVIHQEYCYSNTTFGFQGNCIVHLSFLFLKPRFLKLNLSICICVCTCICASWGSH